MSLPNTVIRLEPSRRLMMVLSVGYFLACLALIRLPLAPLWKVTFLFALVPLCVHGMLKEALKILSSSITGLVLLSTNELLLIQRDGQAQKYALEGIAQWGSIGMSFRFKKGRALWVTADRKSVV